MKSLGYEAWTTPWGRFRTYPRGMERWETIPYRFPHKHYWLSEMVFREVRR